MKFNFRNFLEETSPGAFSSDRFTTTAYNGQIHPEITMEFPTVTKRGEILRVKVQGANYCFHISNGITVLIPRKTYHKKYNRLPRAKDSNRSGDLVTAIFYKYKGDDEENYKLKGFQIDQLK